MTYLTTKFYKGVKLLGGPLPAVDDVHHVGCQHERGTVTSKYFKWCLKLALNGILNNNDLLASKHSHKNSSHMGVVSSDKGSDFDQSFHGGKLQPKCLT